MNQRTKATDGTQAHRDLATIKNNINYWIKVHGMTRDEAKARVEHPTYVMKSAEEVNKETAAEVRRQANLKARAEREAKARAEREAEAEAERATEAERAAEVERAAEAKARAEAEPKTGSKLKRQGGMKVICNQLQYQTLVAAMVSTGKYDAKETKLRSFHWKIGRAHV